jgi:hypothetical protein
MSAGGPRLRALNIWAKREGMCLAIIERALQVLRAEEDLPESECDLNRLFYFRLLESSRELYPMDPVAPTSECNNQPDPDDETRVARENKRPDFQWVYLDQYEPDPERSSKQFVVECKRLGTPRRSGWVFNVNYVTNGICRFRDPVWGYGRRFRAGAMVGYWQSMELPQVLREVNEEAARHALPDVAPIGEQTTGGHRSEHLFERSFPVSPFRLRHLWVDLRPAQK